MFQRCNNPNGYDIRPELLAAIHPSSDVKTIYGLHPLTRCLATVAHNPAKQNDLPQTKQLSTNGPMNFLSYRVGERLPFPNTHDLDRDRHLVHLLFQFHRQMYGHPVSGQPESNLVWISLDDRQRKCVAARVLTPS
jgi:hypothetical protein